MSIHTSSRSFLRVLGLAGLSLIASLSAIAQTTFTFKGNVLSSSFEDYQNGDAFTVTFVTKANIAAGYGYADPDYLGWVEEAIDDPELFESVSFTGSTGTWVRPVAPDFTSSDDDGPESYVNLYSGNWLDVMAYSDAAEKHDVFTSLSAGGFRVWGLMVQGGIDLSFDLNHATLPDINDYFGALAGTYTMIPAEMSPSSIALEGGRSIDFTVHELTISTAIPEPGTYAIWAGLAALGSVLIYRRRTRR